jgi:hypothetical protein
VRGSGSGNSGRPGSAAARTGSPSAAEDHAARKRAEADQRKQARAERALQDRIADLESRITEHERAIKDLEARMAAPGFFVEQQVAQPVIDEHQTLMWKVGELLSQWEMLTAEAEQKR